MTIHKTAILGIIFMSLFSACSENENDFKSKVPVSSEIPSWEERLNKMGQNVETEAEIILPDEINLDIPFYPQAPDGNWELPWQEACEEASLILAHAYATHETLSKDDFRQTVLDLVEWQKENLGDYKHTSIDQTAQMLESFFNFKEFKVLENPATEDLKKELAQGHVIVSPFAGRLLNNPFYSGEGPEYHMMVIRGYDETHFITNDVGTRRGENFIYPYQTILSALHDWNDMDIERGNKKILILYRD